MRAGRAGSFKNCIRNRNLNSLYFSLFPLTGLYDFSLIKYSLSLIIYARELIKGLRVCI